MWVLQFKVRQYFVLINESCAETIINDELIGKIEKKASHHSWPTAFQIIKGFSSV